MSLEQGFDIGVDPDEFQVRLDDLVFAHERLVDDMVEQEGVQTAFLEDFDIMGLLDLVRCIVDRVRMGGRCLLGIFLDGLIFALQVHENDLAGHDGGKDLVLQYSIFDKGIDIWPVGFIGSTLVLKYIIEGDGYFLRETFVY